MANCKKYTKAACGHLFKHYERAKDENGEYLKFGNQEIDTGKSHLNYNLAAHEQPDRQGDFVKQRCSEVKMQNRADVNVMCSWVITAPKQLRENETEQFFKEAYKFLSERYGKDNIISAHVHMDETVPHIHFAFVPVVRDKKKDILKVSAKEAINKRELQTFHKDLSAYMEKVFGRDVGVENEATKKGNRTIEELKRGTAIEKMEEITHKTEEMTKKSEELAQVIQEANKKINALKKEEKNLDKQIKELDNTFKDKQFTMKKIENIKPIKGWFGLKNVTMDDVESLKSMAMIPLQDKKILNTARQEIERLKIENAEQKKQIPTMLDKIEQNKELSRLIDNNNKLTAENNRLAARYENLVGAVRQLPAEEIELINKIINAAEAPAGRKRSHNADIE